MTITYGKFKMMTPAWSRKGYWIIGALVGADKTATYVNQIEHPCTRGRMRYEYQKLREQIHKDHPGIKEEFTVYRPRVGYN